MKATPIYWPREAAPAEDIYVAVDRSGEVLSLAIWCKKGQELPELLSGYANPIGYVRFGEIEATAKAI